MTQKIILKTDEELSQVPAYSRLAIVMNVEFKERKISRREFPDILCDTIYNFDGEIYFPNGRPFYMSDTYVDFAFGNDGSFRWISDFLLHSKVPPKQKPQRRILDRLRLIVLYLEITKGQRVDKIFK